MSLLYDFNQSADVEKVTMKWPCDEYIIPAGTPMSRTGIANDENAIGILAAEARVEFSYPLSIAPHIGKKEPKGNKDYTFFIITGGFVNLKDAEASYGEKISDAAKEAMTGIKFVDEDEPSSFGGGGGDLLETVETEVPLVITFDGDLTGKEVASSIGTNAVKVSDSILTVKEIIGSVITVSMNDGSSDTYTVTENLVQDMSAMGMPVIMVTKQDGESPAVQVVASEVSADDPTGNTVTMTAGIWFIESTDNYYISSLTCPNATTTTTKTQLKPDLLPEHTHKWDDLEDAICRENIEYLLDVKNGEFAFMDGMSGYILNAPVGLENGKTYTVTWDGVEYECNAVVEENSEYLGNVSVMGNGADTGEPFLYVSMNGVQIFVIDVDAIKAGITESTYHTLSISSSVIEPIDNKFIDAEWMAVGEKLNKTLLENASFEIKNEWYLDINENAADLIVLRPNTNYVVEWDGEKYSCVCQAFTNEIGLFYALGNLYKATDEVLGNPKENQPFAICNIMFGGELKGLYVSSGTLGTHTFSIYEGRVANKIPEEFMPELTQVILISPGGKKFKTTVDDSGQLVTTEV